MRRLTFAVVAALVCACSLVMGATPTAAASAPTTPKATSSIATLPHDECVAAKLTAAQCVVVVTATPTTAPAAMNAASTSAGYWYWGWHFQVCAIYGCWYWKISHDLDGDANGRNVWVHHNGCTPSGYGTSITWCGYWYNGGGPPTYYVQGVLNFNACVGPYGIGCFGHGMRENIDDWGNYIGGFVF